VDWRAVEGACRVHEVGRSVAAGIWVPAVAGSAVGAAPST
jgi:hypothetical protein